MSDARGTPFSVDGRRALLDEFFAVGARLDAVPASLEPAPAELARYAELRRAYREQLPVLPLSRCPFTNTVYEHSIDPFGLDGPWWDYRSPNRPLEMMRGNVLAFTGAVQLREPLEQMPFLCRPGPGAPFVVPRMLRRPGVRGVLYSLPIGVHTGYVVTYFADPAPDDLEWFNDWGTDFYQFESDTDRLGWHQASASAADHDFALEKYLSSGQLLWISPGDGSMTLREGARGCPYLDLEGSRLPQLVQDGERWYAEYPVDDVDDARGEVVPAASPVSAPESEPDSKPTAVVQPEPMPSPPLAAAVGKKFCKHCGQPRRPGAKFCASCGKS